MNLKDRIEDFEGGTDDKIDSMVRAGGFMKVFRLFITKQPENVTDKSRSIYFPRKFVSVLPESILYLSNFL